MSVTPAEAARIYFERFGPRAGYPAHRAEIDTWFDRLRDRYFAGDEAAAYAALRAARAAQGGG